MFKKSSPESGFFTPRCLVAVFLCLSGSFLAELSFARAPQEVAESSKKNHSVVGKLSRPARIPNPTKCTTASAPSGPGWSIVSSPSPSTTQTNQLSGVTCSSPSDCWAAGYFTGPTGVWQTLIARWDGQSWAVFPSPNNSGSNILQSVTCSSSTDCWTVGAFISGNTETLIEHWDGTSWSIISSPNPDPSHSALYDVTCSSSASCWAVGYYSGGGVVEHWDGASWLTINSAPRSQVGELYGVTCSSANQCWAVGGGPSGPAIEQWNGTSWNIVPSPAVGGYLIDVSCLSVNQCFAIGNAQQSFIEQWNGTSWAVINEPIPATATKSYLSSITCNSTTCWAIGGYTASTGDDNTLIEQWDGSSWQIVSSPNTESPPNNALFAVTCSSLSQCWAVGATSPNQPNFTVSQTLIEEYSLTIPPLTNIASRMTHGPAGAFDVDLPLTGKRGVECRSGGANRNYSVVFSLANDVTNCGNAGTVGGTVVAGPNSNQCTENLTGVPNAQYISVELDNVVDVQNNTGSVAVSMGVLVGDTNADGFVDAIDVSQTKSQSGNAVGSSNFREDVNVDGFADAIDASFVKSKSGTALPTSP